MAQDWDLSKILSTAYAGGNWFILPKAFLGFLSTQETVLLAYLIDSGNMVKAVERNDGWFYRTVERIKRDTYMDRNIQTRILKRLQNKGLISLTRRGVPPKRFIRINFEALQEALQKVMDEESNNLKTS